ncbi:MAG: hypothetical protein WC593_07340 [Methanoregula sp.]
MSEVVKEWLGWCLQVPALPRQQPVLNADPADGAPAQGAGWGPGLPVPEWPEPIPVPLNSQTACDDRFKAGPLQRDSASPRVTEGTGGARAG